ncbi:MAG: hypothetical protein NTU80_14580 [Verrucomicrobia bacterium]|nr:hypothetical protein [Verrucomicrobiota bacterium]
MRLKEARKVIAALQPQILKRIDYTDEELAKLAEEFQVHYRREVVPRLADIRNNIDRRAIHWVDVDMDGRQELVF